MDASTSRRWRSIAGWVISLAVLGVIAWLVDWGGVVGELRKVRYGLLVPLTGVVALHYLLRSLRWRYLLPAPRPARFGVYNDALMLGNMANFLLPLRAGEFLRPLMLAKDTPYTFSHGLVSVVIERFLDLTAVLTMFAVLIARVPDVPDLAYSAVYGFSALALAILTFILVGSLRPDAVRRICGWALRPLPERLGRPLLAFVDPFLEGARVLRSRANLLRVVALTGAVWATCYLYYLLSLMMFALPTPGWPTLSVVVMIALAVGFPSAPGFIGVYQAGCVVGLGLFGVSEELAVAYSLVSHAHQFLYICGFGLVVILTGKRTFSVLRQTAPEPEDAAAS